MDQKLRIGNGYDIHRLVEKRKLVIGGVEIPYHHGLLGHSDADVLTHSIMDALLGALALGDIGMHFPPDDEEYRDISSLELLLRVKFMLSNQNYKILNIDSIIHAERPKLISYIPDIRRKLADTLSLKLDKVSVKATTMEKLGPVGE